MLPIHLFASRRNWLTDMVGLALLLIFFYTLWLGSYPFFTPDEGRYAEVAREMTATGDYVTPRVNGVAFLDKPALYYWLQALAILLFGVKEWAVRLFPVLFGVAGCLVTYACGRQLFDRKTGLLSAAILATTPLYFGAAHYANLDLEVAVWISSALLLFITGVQSKGRLHTYLLLGAYFCAACACLTKGLIGIAFPLMIGGAWIALLGRWKLLTQIYLFTGIILFIAIVIPWYILAQQANPDFLHYFFVTQHFTRFLSAAEFNNKTPFWFYVPVVLIGFFPWIIFLYQAIKSALKQVLAAKHEHQTELFLLLWITIIFLFFSIPKSKIVTYMLPIFPAAALLTGRYLASIWTSISQKKITQYSLGFAVAAVLFALALILARYTWGNFPNAFVTYLIILDSLLVICAGIAIFLRNHSFSSLFLLCLTCNILFLSILTMGASHLNQGSAKPLVSYLKTVKQPEDEVIAYFKYYYDVPLYLEERITVATQWDTPDIAKKDNWMREFWNAMAFQKTDDWLINEDNFWTRWESEKRVFVFVNTNYFDKFKLRAKSYFHLGQHNDIILLSNKPTLVS